MQASAPHPLLLHVAPGQRPRSYPPYMASSPAAAPHHRLPPRMRTLSTPPSSEAPPVAAALRIRLYRVPGARVNTNGHLELRADARYEFAFEVHTRALTIKPPNELPHERSADYVQLECNSHTIQGLMDAVEAIDVVEGTLALDWVPPRLATLALHSSAALVCTSPARLHVQLARRSRLRFGPRATCGELHLTLLDGGNEVHDARYIYTLCIEGDGVSECGALDASKVPETTEHRTQRQRALLAPAQAAERHFWASYDAPLCSGGEQQSACAVCMQNVAVLTQSACGHATLCGSCAAQEQCHALFLAAGCFVCRQRQPITTTTTEPRDHRRAQLSL